MVLLCLYAECHYGECHSALPKLLEDPMDNLYNGILTTWHGTIMHRFRDDYIFFHVSKTTAATEKPIDSYSSLAWILKL
jgi:hypothetical protein